MGRYTHKIAIGNHRIKHINHQNKTVHFQVKNYNKGGAKQMLTLSSGEFIRRFGLHILLKGFTRIRHYGILSSSWKKVKLPELQIMLASKKIPLLKLKPKPELLHRKCPTCTKEILETVLLLIKEDPERMVKKIKQMIIKHLRILQKRAGKLLLKN